MRNFNVTIRRYSLIGLCCLFNSTSIFSQVDSHTNETSKIIGGTLADPNAYPWVAQLMANGASFICGGTLIAPNWVLTAGHCAMGGIVPTYVRLNPYQTLNPQMTTETIDIEQIFVFPGYTLSNNEFVPDICLIKLESNAQSHNAIPIMNQATDLALIEEGDWCKVLGWGSTNIMGTQSNTMKEGEMEIIGTTFCSTAYAGAINYDQDSTICAGYLAGQTPVGAGAGDSGGPLFVLKNGEPLLVGVVSGGYLPITTADYPGIYTKVYTVRDWIQNTINLSANMNELIKDQVQIYVNSSEIIVNSGIQLQDEVNLILHDSQGKIVQATAMQLEFGERRIEFNQDIVNGIYYLTLSSSNFYMNQKIGLFR